jgi:DNA-binding ferritin-like protein
MEIDEYGALTRRIDEYGPKIELSIKETAEADALVAQAKEAHEAKLTSLENLQTEISNARRRLGELVTLKEYLSKNVERATKQVELNDAEDADKYVQLQRDIDVCVHGYTRTISLLMVDE